MKTLGKVAIAVGAASVAVVAYGWSHFPILPFRPVMSDPSSSLHEYQLKKEDKAAVASVLHQYGERYSETEDAIWITPRLFFDLELRWNYTSKSKEPIQRPEPMSVLRTAMAHH